MTPRRALIHWRSKAAGGRMRPPMGEPPLRYIAPVDFSGMGDAWSATVAWSFVVHLIERFDAYEWLADVHFLVAEAPHHLVREGARFELYEGALCVAEGEVLGDQPAL